MEAGTLQALVAAAASLHPDRAAVTYDGGSVSAGPVSLLYRDLVSLSGELARHLRESCSDHNGVIGLYCGDDLFLPVWILGILQSPAAYAPLDPEAPGLLSARVLTHCGLKYCAVRTDMMQLFQAALSEHVSLEVCVVLQQFRLTLMRVKPLQDTKQKSGPEPQDVAAAVLKEAPNLAYVLHTSGTTGSPKIVRVPHRCILPNILHLRSLFQMSPDDVVFLASPLTFDPSVVDIFLALSSGAQLLIVPTVMKKMPRHLARLLFRDHKNTVLQVTPTLLMRFGRRVIEQEVMSSSSSLRVLALGGETCPSVDLLRSWRHKDNKTHIYNIYGITEVSCWACCHKIPESVLQSSDTVASSVPLGAPLMDTVVEVRDGDGHAVTEGEGQVFVGGDARVCLLDGEETLVPGTMRATGDWVNVRDNQLFYLGRRDRLIKRHGKRVNLDSLQQLILGLPQVEACAIALHETSRLLAFVVPSTCGDQDEESLTSVQKSGEQTSSSAEHHGEEVGGAGGDTSRLILKQLSLLLPSHSVPDSLLLVPALSLNSHGKVDMKHLLNIYQTQRQSLESDSLSGDIRKLRQTLLSLWKEALGLTEDCTVSEDSNFLFSGGDSLKALHLCEDIMAAAGGTSPELLELILDGSFSDVLRHIASVTLMLPVDGGRLSGKRHQEVSSATLAKRQRTGGQRSGEERLKDEDTAVRVIRRAGDMMQRKNRSPDVKANYEEKGSGNKHLCLSLSWSSDTGRCVDASPVILVRDTGDRQESTVFIGSHSHRLQALDLTTGRLLWERVLGGRIEASAAVSRCGNIVVVGCYDGCVYFLCAASGETRWVFETGDAVKSCPVVDPLTGLVMVGSHDGHVYALDPQVQQCVWRRHCEGGAVFSSPCLHPSLRQLYVSSLGGRLLCLHPDSGDILWSTKKDFPFFSSPNASGGQVVIGSVDGNICCFSTDGKLLWERPTEGPVFSSPCISSDQQRVLCGSHDGRLYCLNSSDGSIVWTFKTSGKVYSSPCLFQVSGLGQVGALVAVASTDGALWILDGGDGRMLASFTLPGELFSSPVVWGRSIVVGCRNDYVYCLELQEVID